MGQKTIRFSDLSSELILSDDKLARLVVLEHPALTNGPVEIEALASELFSIQDDQLNVAIVDLYLPGQEKPKRVYLSVAHFDALAKAGNMVGVLAGATSVKGSARRSSAGSQSADGKINYASSEHAGEPHRGRTTEAEKDYVRDNFDEVNERLREQGLRVLDLNDPDMVGRYGLEELVKETGQ